MRKPTAIRFYQQTCLPRWQQATVWSLQIAAASSFFVVGSAKLIGTEDMVGLFADIGWGQWFRHLTGSLQIFSATLLLFPDKAFWSGLLLILLMVGAIFIHLMLMSNLLPAFVLLCMTAAVTWLRRSPNLRALDIRGAASVNRFQKKTHLLYWQQVTVWILQIAAASSFFIAGFAKLIGTKDMVMLFDDTGWGQLILFNDIGWGQWFQHLTGSLQIFSAILLLLPDRAFLGGLLLMPLVMGAMLIRVVLGGSLLPAFGLLCLIAGVTWFRREA